MEDFTTILILENEFEAQLLEDILTDREIPYVIKTYHDSAYNGIFQSQKGWGRLEAPETYKAEIMEIYENLEVGEGIEESVEGEELPPEAE
jgi:hypothetical protein